MKSVSLRGGVFALVAVVSSLTASPAQGAFLVQLDVVNDANVSNSLTGTYATVRGVALDTNTIEFTVRPNDLLWGAGNTVVVNMFGFNHSVLTGALTIVPPAGWTLTGTGNMDGFGQFMERTTAGGSGADQDPLVVTVHTTTVFGSLAALEDAFLVRNSQDHYFAAHLRGFTFPNNTTSAFFTDGPQPDPREDDPPDDDPPNAVPAPAGLVLALTALPVLGLRRLLRRKAV